MEILEFLSSSSSSSDEDKELFGVLFSTLQKKYRNDETTMNLLTDQEFREQFRVPRKVVEDLAKLLEKSKYYKKCSTIYDSIAADRCLQIFLKFAGQENTGFREIAENFNILLSKVHRIIENIAMFLSNLAEDFIKWPSAEERRGIKEAFREMGFPGVVGVIGGNHFKIDAPVVDSEHYKNDQEFFSVHMQAVCDHRRRFLDVFIGYPGSVTDTDVFIASNLCENLEEHCEDGYLLGDEGYPCLRHLLSPYPYTEDPKELNFNTRLYETRKIIDESFELLRQRFRKLKHIKMKKLDSLCHFIRACCVLHNLSIEDKIELGPVLEAQIVNGDYGAARTVENEAGWAFRNYVACIL